MLTSENENELLRRIEKLERRNRVVLTGGVAILLLVCLAAAQRKVGDYDVVRARSFELLDSKGNQRGLLGFIDTIPVLRLGESPDRPRVSIESQDTQTVMTLTSPGPGTSHSSVVLVAADPKSIVQADILRGQVESQGQKQK
jgi:hypothetical protein